MTITELNNLDREGLLALWVKTYQSPAPRGISQPFLRRFLAYEIQVRQYGGLSKQVLKALTTDGAATKTKTSTLAPGGRLIREWNGVTHTVEVTDQGYCWNGNTYRSLSAIARAITGAHWSGPRFFGLTRTSAA